MRVGDEDHEGHEGVGTLIRKETPEREISVPHTKLDGSHIQLKRGLGMKPTLSAP